MSSSCVSDADQEHGTWKAQWLRFLRDSHVPMHITFGYDKRTLWTALETRHEHHKSL